MAERELDLLLWGATGYTGGLVAEHLCRRHGAGGGLRWGLGGRDEGKLAAVRDRLGPGAEGLTLVLGDAVDRASMEALARRTRVVCSTVGPFARYGSELVGACARSGTDYCDITGEVHWVRAMMDAWEDTARESGARIVNFCGFDSIPSDLGCLFLQREAEDRLGGPCPEVRAGIMRLKGAFSGGTYASVLNALEAAREDPAVRRIMADPYALNPEGERRGPDGPDQRLPARDDTLDAWTAPFVMGPVNTRVVRRSNALMDWRYGRDFRYSETLCTGRGLVGRARAAAVAAGLAGFLATGLTAPGRALLRRLALPAPGEGPSERERAEGRFVMRFVGRHPAADGPLVVEVSGDRDPGYGATSRMLGEAAACLALDEAPGAGGGGFPTPAALLGERLIGRLEAHAGVTFRIVEEPD